MVLACLNLTQKEEVEMDENIVPCCPQCSGEAVVLGKLAKLEWFRCRNCGAEFCVEDEFKQEEQ